ERPVERLARLEPRVEVDETGRRNRSLRLVSHAEHDAGPSRRALGTQRRSPDLARVAGVPLRTALARVPRGCRPTLHVDAFWAPIHEGLVRNPFGGERRGPRSWS